MGTARGDPVQIQCMLVSQYPRVQPARALSMYVTQYSIDVGRHNAAVTHDMWSDLVTLDDTDSHQAGL